jgi:Protein of unknown function (DUF1569)
VTKTTSAKPGTVDTAKVTDRRTLRFETFADVRRDLDALASAHRAGTLRTAGNWTPGQILSHLAAFMEYPFDGYPPELPSPPKILALLLRFMKNKYLYKGLPVGVKIPGIPAGTVGQTDAPFDDALKRLRSAIDRLNAVAPAGPNPVFGVMTHDEWKAMNLRHCELHLSFLHPR